MKINIDNNNIVTAWGDAASVDGAIEVPNQDLDGSVTWHYIDGQIVDVNSFEYQVSQGYTLNGVTIAIDVDNLTEFSKLTTMLMLVGASDEQIVTIVDISGVIQTLTYAVYKNLVIGAGQRYLTLWTNLKISQNG